MAERLFKKQLIGRIDKNGIPIKEGDKIAIFGKIEWGGIVIYNPYMCAFAFEPDYHFNKPEDFSGSFAHGWGESQESEPEKSWEIIGSIYE